MASTVGDQTSENAVDVFISFEVVILFATTASILHGVFDLHVEAKMRIELFEEFLQGGKQRPEILLLDLLVVVVLFVDFAHVRLAGVMDLQRLQLRECQIFDGHDEQFGLLNLALERDGHLKVMVDHRDFVFRQLNIEFDEIEAELKGTFERGQGVLADEFRLHWTCRRWHRR